MMWIENTEPVHLVGVTRVPRHEVQKGSAGGIPGKFSQKHYPAPTICKGDDFGA